MRLVDQLIRCLRENRHAVIALVRSPEASRAVGEAGAEPVIADALDATGVQEAVAQVRPDAVISELTALPRHNTRAEMAVAAEHDRKVRIEGNANLLAALGAAGVRRYLLQSSGFWYAPGAGSQTPRQAQCADHKVDAPARSSAFEKQRSVYQAAIFLDSD